MKKSSNLLFLIIIVALAFRLIGINHSLPFIFHPDEPTVVRSALGVRFFPNPKHFDWSHLYIYLNFLVYMGFSAFRNLLTEMNLKTIISSIMPIIWNDELVFYLLTRIFTAVLGSLTLIPVYKAVKEFLGEKAAIFSALSLAVFPIHVWQSHYTMPDIAMVFFLAWGMYFSSLLIKHARYKNYVLAGFFIGLSASTKYNGGLAAVCVPLAHSLRIFKSEKKEPWLSLEGILSLLASGISAIVGFVLGTPFALLDFDTFVRTDGPKGALWQFTNVGSRTFLDHIASFFMSLKDTIAEDVAYTPLIALLFCFGLLVWSIWKKRFDEHFKFLFFATFMSLFLIYYVSGFDKVRSHYFLVVYPFMAVCFGIFLAKISDFLLKKNLYSVSILFTAFSFLPLFYFSSLNTLNFASKDTRLELYEWLVAHVKQTDIIVYDANIVKDVIDKTDLPSDKAFIKLRKYSKGYLVVTDEDFDSLEKKAPGNVVVNFSTFEQVQFFDDTLRHGPAIKIIRFSDAPNDKTT